MSLNDEAVPNLAEESSPLQDEQKVESSPSEVAVGSSLLLPERKDDTTSSSESDDEEE